MDRKNHSAKSNSRSLSSLRSSITKKIAKQESIITNYDAIVIGVGSMGSSSCYHLAKQGIKVLGIEQFGIPHEFGSHTGQSRIIRKAYFEHPNYVPLLEKAYDSWKTFETEIGEQLYYKTGLLYAGPEDHLLLKGVKNSSNKYNLEIKDLSTTEVKKRFPQFTFPKNHKCILEPNAGFLPPERVILNYVEQALLHGAIIKTHEKVINWSTEDDAIRLATNKATYRCKKLVISSGAWISDFVPHLKPKLNVTKQVMAWGIPNNPDQFSQWNFPCWNMADPNGNGLYYGMPILPKDHFGGQVGMKIAHHYLGETINPDNLERSPNADEEIKLRNFAEQFMPDCLKSFVEMKTCLYTNTSDEHFVIDLHPENKNVVVAGGFSGHGFKFSSILGEILCDLAIKGSTQKPINFLNINRFST